ncbi:MAG: hypothetical protein JXR60_07095, partial [Bacteroidales bacterium]|nr:hypothetical protein [Bacteroidales bacterium]
SRFNKTNESIEAFHILSDKTYFSGNVGIGTATATAKIDIKGDENSEENKLIALDHEYSIFSDNIGNGYGGNTRLWFNSATGGSMVFGPRSGGSANRLANIRFRSEVTQTEGVLRVFSTAGNWANPSILSKNSSQDNAGLVIESSTARWGVAIIGSSSSSSDGFWIKNLTYNRIDFVINESTGYVGIGTSSPSAKLDVAGNLIIKKDGQYLTFSASNGGNPVPNIGPSVEIGSSNGVITYWTSGIGYNTLVVGKLWSKSEIVVQASYPWSDFVFAKEYKLRSIQEVEKYIEEHHHLPEMPSADDVEQNGINVGEMDAKLLQKIEELTLYIIEQQKEIELLKKEIYEEKN